MSVTATVTATVTTANGVITHTNVKDRDYKRGGKTHEGQARDGHNVEVKPGEYIRLTGTIKKVRYLKVHNSDGTMRGKSIPYDEAYDITFRVGDIAEYDSYNLSYTGEILSIGAKTVAIDASGTGSKVKRLRLHEFSWRNDNFDIEKIRASNADTMMYI